MFPSSPTAAAASSSSSFTSIAPGRLCLFGEHQDYLHLPVIASALPLYCRIHVVPDPSTRVITLHVPALQQTRHYDLDNLPATAKDDTAAAKEDGDNNNASPDFALAALIDVVKIDKWQFPCGATCTSTTEIPLQSGCSSSSAFCVAWIQALHRLSYYEDSSSSMSFFAYIPLTPLEVAQRAHRAEVLHFGAPGGNMDHITSAFGGTIRIGAGGSGGDDDDTAVASNADDDDDRAWHVQRLPPLSESSNNHTLWILVDSGEPKDTMKHLHRCKDDRFKLLEERLGGDWDNTTNLESLTDDERQLLKATLVNRDTEAQAAILWIEKASSSANATTADITPKEYSLDIQQHLAQLMNDHHEALRDGLHLSTPRMEKLREAALKAGAMGFKLVGSGGGGCGVAWCVNDDDVANAVETALKEAGAKQTWRITHASQGAWIEEEEQGGGGGEK